MLQRRIFPLLDFPGLGTWGGTAIKSFVAISCPAGDAFVWLQPWDLPYRSAEVKNQLWGYFVSWYLRGYCQKISIEGILENTLTVFHSWKYHQNCLPHGLSRHLLFIRELSGSYLWELFGSCFLWELLESFLLWELLLETIFAQQSMTRSAKAEQQDMTEDDVHNLLTWRLWG